MATIDLTRSIFEPRKRYAGVRMQQGRVVLDDDHNEGGDLAAEDARRTRLDVIGPSGSPDDGFKIENATLAAGLVDFDIRAGTMYVGGVPVRLDHDTTLAGQPDWVCIANADRAQAAGQPADVAYLEVWQQPVSAEEDRELFEPALGGPDTTVRLRTMARVRRQGVTATSCAEAWAEVVDALDTDGIGTWNPDTCELETDLRLLVEYVVGGVPEDLCSPSVTAGYLGAENQAIRVQIVDRLGGAGTGELTWSYNNTAPLYRAHLVSDTVVALETLPRDEAHWPLLGQTVEILPWSAVLVPDGDPSALHGEVLGDGDGRASPDTEGAMVSLGGGHLSRLASSYDVTTHQITLDSAVPGGFNTRGAVHVAAGIDTDRNGDDRSALVFVRVWDRGSDLASAARLAWTAGSPLTLGNSGINVTITGDQVGGDAHWIIGARPNTPDQVLPWAFEDGSGRAPNGVRRFLVPLAVVTWSGEIGAIHDCRETFHPLTRIRNCCRYTVGDGETSHGDYTTIQEAIDNLPDEGGEICVLPGTYPDEVTIDGRDDIVIHGCGPRSLISVAAPASAAVTIRAAARIVLRELGITSESGWGVELDDDTEEIELDRLEIHVRDRGAVLAEAVVGLDLHDSLLVGTELAADPTEDSEIGRVPLVWVHGAGVVIRDNRIQAEPAASPVRRVPGGVQIAGDSSSVLIERNLIQAGNGHGITLGSVIADVEGGVGIFSWVPYWYWDDNCLRQGWRLVGVPGDETVTLESGGALDRIWIRENRIAGMGGDGIGVAWFFDAAPGGAGPSDIIIVRYLRVIQNLITGCNIAEREPVNDFLALWSGHGAIALADVEDGVWRDNEIRDNGTGNPDPLCGVFVLNVLGAVLDRNRITNNGQRRAEHAGWLGGIVLPLASPQYEDEDPAWDGRAAARVVDNVVVAPEGPAVILRAFWGPLLVERNELTTFSAWVQSALGQAVEILNFGFFSEFDGGSTTADRGGPIVFSNNTVTWQPPASAGTGWWITRLASLDDVCARDNVGRADIGELFMLIDLIAWAFTVDVADNRLRETLGRMLVSIASYALLNQTVDNVTTHCVYVWDLGVVSEGTGNRSIVDLYIPEFCQRLVGQPGSGAVTGRPATAPKPQYSTYVPAQG